MSLCEECEGVGRITVTCSCKGCDHTCQRDIECWDCDGTGQTVIKPEYAN